MTELKQQLEAMRDRMAEQHYKETGHVATEWAVMNYQAGFNAAIPIILKAVEQRDKFMSAQQSFKDEYNLELLKQLAESGK